MELSEREKLLIVEGLTTLEFDCRGGMSCDTERRLGGYPEPKEVDALRDKLEEVWKIPPLEKLETCACDGCAQCAIPGECDMDAGTVHKGTPMCLECAKQACKHDETDIAQHDKIQLTMEEQKRFADALLNPPSVAPAMKRAVELHRKLVEPSNAETTKRLKHEHEWEVYSSAIGSACIMVRCNCGAFGNIPNGKFENADWNEAFHAPSNPYPLREGLVASVVETYADPPDAALTFG